MICYIAQEPVQSSAYSQFLKHGRVFQVTTTYICSADRMRAQNFLLIFAQTGNGNASAFHDTEGQEHINN